MPIETVNLHLERRCNMKCEYCYGQFPERPAMLPIARWREILRELARVRVKRVSFSGGEPTLFSGLLDLLREAKSLDLQVSMITNGTFLSDEMLAQLDMVGLTLDSADDVRLRVIGRAWRGGDSYTGLVRSVVERAKAHGVRVKLNTVVTTRNVDEDLSAIIVELAPSKWKPMQFTEVMGENDSVARELRVTEDAFRSFVARHKRVADAGIWVAPETDATIRGTYAMIDPSGRVFQHGPGGHRRSAPVYEVGFEAAFEQAGGYDRAAFVARGGDLDVRRLRVL
ncbi:MAG: viperin family antiviral radical SAM protein [Myxococcales bacterium]|nr:viperin family antiviral radical SAM protein [Myxococcales bacterium]